MKNRSRQEKRMKLKLFSLGSNENAMPNLMGHNEDGSKGQFHYVNVLHKLDMSY